MLKRSYESSLIALLAVASVSACGKKKSSDNTDTSGGTVTAGGATPTTAGSGLTVAGTVAIDLGLADAPKPDQAWAFPLINGAADSHSLSDVKKVDLDATGNFSFALANDPSAAQGMPPGTLNADGTVDKETLKGLLVSQAGMTDAEADAELAKDDATIISDIKAMNSQHGGGNQEVTDYVVLLVDSKATGASKFVNFVGLPTSGDANLLNLPIKNAGGTIGTGTITPTADSTDVKANVSAETGASVLGISTDIADQFANTGGVLRVIKNIVNNCDASATGRCLDAQTTFQWHGSAAKMTSDFSTADDWTYSGYSFIFNFRGTSYKFADVCTGTTPVKLAFYPPEDLAGAMDNGTTGTVPATGITTEGYTKPKDDGFNDGGKSCDYTGTKNPYSYVAGRSDGSFSYIPISGLSIPHPLAKGDWKITVSGGAANVSDEFHLDLASASPIDANGVARVWVPGVKITKDSSGYVTQVDVKFFTSDGKTWTETTDPTALLAAIGGAGTVLDDGIEAGVQLLFDFTDANGKRTTEGALLKQVGTTGVFTASGFKNKWDLPTAQGSGGNCASGHLCGGERISYTIRGTQINFNIGG